MLDNDIYHNVTEENLFSEKQNILLALENIGVLKSVDIIKYQDNSSNKIKAECLDFIRQVNNNEVTYTFYKVLTSKFKFSSIEFQNIISYRFYNENNVLLGSGSSRIINLEALGSNEVFKLVLINDSNLINNNVFKVNIRDISNKQSINEIINTGSRDNLNFAYRFDNSYTLITQFGVSSVRVDNNQVLEIPIGFYDIETIYGENAIIVDMYRDYYTGRSEDLTLSVKDNKVVLEVINPIDVSASWGNYITMYMLYDNEISDHGAVNGVQTSSFINLITL